MEKAGYSFDGWTANADGSGTAYAVGDALNLNADKTVYAKWNLISYTITYLDTDKASGSAPNVTVGAGAVTLGGGGTLSRGAYFLSGWLIGGTNYSLTDSYTLNTDVDASPVWAQYSITYVDTLGDGGALPNNTFGAGITQLDANSNRLTRSGGWVLAGWTIGGVDYNLADNFNLSSDETATARWVIGGYTIHYLDTDATSGVAPGDDVALNSVLVSGPGTLVRSHYHFVGWAINGTTYRQGDLYSISTNVEAVPVWERFTLTYSAPSKDRGSVPTDLVGAGSETIDANPGSLERDGWYLAGWNIGGVEYDLGDGFTLSADATATARWARYTITYSDTNAATGSAPSSTLGFGTISLAGNAGSLARTGYYLAGWTIGGVNFDLSASYLLSGDTAATPRWAQFLITYFGANKTSGSTPATTSYAGTYTLPDNSNNLLRTGYDFAGWVINGTNYASGESFNVIKNVNVFARWLRCGITYTAADKNSGSVPGNRSGCVTVAIAKNSGNLNRNGWFFSGWSIGGVSYQPGDNFALTTAVTASAVWARYSITYLPAEATSGFVPGVTSGFGNTTLASNTGSLQRDNYYFAGWVLGNVEYNTGGTYNLRGNIFAFAKWKQYKISYQANDADSGAIANDEISWGYLAIPVASHGDLARNGYLFAGWQIGGNTFQSRETYTLTSNVTATAQWIRCIVSYDDGYSNSGNVPDQTTGCSNILALQGTIRRTNFYFSGWVIEGVLYQPGATVTINGHRTAYAQWQRYQISFLGTDASSGKVPESIYGYGTIATPRSAGSLVRPNYYLAGWKINGVDYAFGTTIPLTADLVASPVWSQYSINYSSTTSYSGNMPTRTHGYGTTATSLNAGLVSRPGYRFNGWVIGGITYTEGSNYKLLGNVTAYAKWTKANG
jgi:uncharacterized repeat protein (TIGR02543 family)